MHAITLTEIKSRAAPLLFIVLYETPAARITAPLGGSV